MAKLEFDVHTSLAPARVIEALTDFTERRPDIWPGLERDLYEVYSVGDKSAEIKEGTKMPGMTVWARELYVWSKPGNVTWTVMESNFSKPGSYVSADAIPDKSGTKVHITWEREGSTAVGKMVVGMLKLTGGAWIKSSLKKALGALEQG